MRLNKKTILLLVVLMLAFTVSPALAAEEGGSPLDSLGINFGFLLAQAINFGLIFLLLTLFLWNPMTKSLDQRSEKIKKGLEDAAAAAAARRNAEAEAEKILAQARTEVASLIEEARSRGEEVAKSIEAQAREDAEKIREDARREAQAERDAQLAGLRGQVAAISIAVAQRLLGENLDEKKQQALINDFFAKVPESAKSLSGDVEVVSAMPLEKAEQENVKKQIGADNVTFTVDPSILGGLIIRAGDRVVDGSVRRDLNELSTRLK
ncbi:MAG: ATP synthase F0 subunit B [Phototrophicales bacterium]|nr:MAG: ATP synthase F0 subunit B [Phototrophicales bacterium]RMG77820.1 MAG: ATP synthase F0 subunit B [Chloroflexota bacterium]